MKVQPATAALFVWVLAAVALAVAFIPIRGLASFQAGLLHPLLIPTHAVALAALGLLVGRQAGGERGAYLVIFVAGILAGVGAVMMASVFTQGSFVLLAIAAASGLLVTFDRPAPAFLVALLAAAGGVALAFESVPHEISVARTLYALAGAAIGAGLIVALVALSTSDLERPWLRIGRRIAGSWIAAAAILVLALRLAR